MKPKNNNNKRPEESPAGYQIPPRLLSRQPGQHQMPPEPPSRYDTLCHSNYL